jgi:hypothetical protein
VELPDEPIPVKPVLGPEPAPVPQDPYKRDPNDILREHYKPAIEMALEARRKDLARMDSPLARMEANNMMAAGMNLKSETMMGKGADLLRQSQFNPIHGESLEQAGKAGKEIAGAQLASSELDPTSMISEGRRIALMGSSGLNSLALQESQSTGAPMAAVKTQLYRKLQNLNSKGMEAFENAIKNSGAYSKERADELLVHAQRAQYNALTASLEQETGQKSRIYDAMNRTDSVTTQLAKAAILRSYGPAIKDMIPNWEHATMTEIAAYDPAIASNALHIVEKQISMEREAAAKATVNERWKVREAGPGKVDPNNPFAQSTNLIELSPQEKAELPMHEQAGRLGLENGMKAMYLLDKGIGMGSAARTFFKTGEGKQIEYELEKLSNYTERLAPDTSAAIRGSIVSGQKAGFSDLWLGGTQKLIRKAMTELQQNAHARLAGGKVYSPQYEDKEMKSPPEYPPVGMPVEEIQVKRNGKNLYGYRYFNVGPYASVDYIKDPQDNTWMKKGTK